VLSGELKRTSLNPSSDFVSSKRQNALPQLLVIFPISLPALWIGLSVGLSPVMQCMFPLLGDQIANDT
jgi:hypothetical protein